MLSRKFIESVKLSSRKSYQIAHQAGVHLATLSKILNGIDLVRPGDPRVIKVGRVLGLDPGDCFDEAGRTDKKQRSAAALK